MSSTFYSEYSKESSKKKDRRYILSLTREIMASSSHETAKKRIVETVGLLEKTHPKIATILDEQSDDILAVYQLPEQHRKRMRSTNMLERHNQEIKRRTRVVRIFPNEKSCVRLVASLVMETAEEWMQRKYLDMEETTEIQLEIKNEKAA